MRRIRYLPRMTSVRLLLGLCDRLQRPLPPLSLATSDVSMHPKATRQRHRASTDRTVTAHLSGCASRVDRRSRALGDLRTYSTCRGGIRDLVALCRRTRSLPSRLISYLRGTLRITTQIHITLRRSDRVTRLIEGTRTNIRALRSFSDRTSFRHVLASLRGIRRRVPPGHARFKRVRHL